MNKFAKQLLPFCSLIFIISLWAALEPENFLSLQNFSITYSLFPISSHILAFHTAKSPPMMCWRASPTSQR